MQGFLLFCVTGRCVVLLAFHKIAKKFLDVWMAQAFWRFDNRVITVAGGGLDRGTIFGHLGKNILHDK